MDINTEITENQKLSNNEKTFSPAEVRKLLNSDNREIQRLCKEVNVFPKKDSATGRIFFFKSDIDVLKKIKVLYDKTQKIENNENTALVTANTKIKSINDNPDVNAVVNTVVDARENIVNRLTKIIDEKLDGLDDVIVELIRCKVENEKLKAKIDHMTKENHNLMIDMNKFKPVAFGLYKKAKDEF